MCDMSLSDYVKVEVYDVKGNKVVLNVNPVGQFNPGSSSDLSASASLFFGSR